MPNTETCAVKMFKDVFRQGAEIYQNAEQHHDEIWQKNALHLLRLEKHHALSLLEFNGSELKDYPLAENDAKRLQKILNRYSSTSQLADFIDIEKSLLQCLHDNLRRQKPSALSLNLRKIAIRQQQCLEKLCRNHSASGAFKLA